MTSRMDVHACGVERTSKVLVSATADTPTLSPSTSRVTAPLPLLRGDSCRLPLPSPPLLLPVPLLPPKLLPEELPSLLSPTLPPVMPELPPMLLSRLPNAPPSTLVSEPGASEALESPLLLRPPNTSDNRSARSLALMYFNS